MKLKIKLKMKMVLSWLCACFLLVAATGCAEADYRWELADLGIEVCLHTQEQAEYLDGVYSEISSYANGTEELSRPDPVHFTWEAEPVAETKVTVEKYTVEISEWYNFYQSLQYETTEKELDVYNLRISTEYFWRVTAELSDGKKNTSEPATFRTADEAPRNLYVDGVTNVRDLGGWNTADGGNVKQGMIYRSGRLNESETSAVNIEITSQGIKTMREELGVRTEIDLRTPYAHNVETGGITSSPIGEDINYYNIPMEWVMSSGNYLSNSDYYEAIKQFFAYLADENNYPIVYHCNIGTDRTGLFAFLINGLLGVSEEDLYRDYLFSNFGEIGGARSVSSIRSYVNTVKSYGGDTLSEQIENCLLNIGVPESDIDAFREIMSE